MIVCKSPAEIERMRAANELVAAVLTELRDAIAPGISTGELDAMAEARIVGAGAAPAFKGYHGYPATLCVSINDEVIHGSRRRTGSWPRATSCRWTWARCSTGSWATPR